MGPSKGPFMALTPTRISPLSEGETIVIKQSFQLNYIYINLYSNRDQ